MENACREDLKTQGRQFQGGACPWTAKNLALLVLALSENGHIFFWIHT